MRKSGRYEHFPDPMTMLIVGGAVAGGMMMSGAFSGGGGGMPKISAPALKETAAKTVTSDVTAAEQMNKRMAASTLTADWNKPLLGKKSLLGG